MAYQQAPAAALLVLVAIWWDGKEMLSVAELHIVFVSA